MYTANLKDRLISTGTFHSKGEARRVMTQMGYKLDEFDIVETTGDNNVQ